MSDNTQETQSPMSDFDYKKAVASFFMVAKLYKDKYDALVSAGFTESQALEIIKARGMEI